MPLPISKNQVRNLGSRLRDASVPSEDDLDLVQGVLAAYDEALRATSERLWRDLGITSSGRLKNLGTIIEKLRRDSGTNLAGIQDVAGRRIVLDRSARRSDQDRVRDLVVTAFIDGGRAPRVFDRRETPSRGYRAVHVIVTVDDLPAEIQIRTHWQQRWAELFEKMGDQFGRSIRYEDGTPELDRLPKEPFFERRREELSRLMTSMVDNAVEFSDVIATLETVDDEAAAPTLQEEWAAVEGWMSTVSDTLDAMRALREVGS